MVVNMKVSVYITSSCVMAVLGEYSGKKLRISGMYQEMLPEGIVSNGLVVNKDALSEVIKAFFKKNNLKKSGVGLVIDSESVVSKIIDVPKMTQKQTDRYFANEFGITGSEEETAIFDYTLMKVKADDNRYRYFAAVGEKAVFKEYIDVFSAAGCEVVSINILQTSVLRLFQAVDEFRGKTFIFSAIYGSEIVSMMFDDNEYLFTNKNVLMEERGTPSSAVEISRMLSSMIQFNYARKTTNPLSCAYVCGLFGEETQYYGDMVDAISLPVGPLPSTKDIVVSGNADYGLYCACIGNLIP